MSFLYDLMFGEGTLITLLAAGLAFATIITLGQPMLSRGALEKRMKEVAEHRDAIRARRKAELQARRIGLRTEPEGIAKLIDTLVKRFEISRLVASEDSKHKLQQAGLRGSTPLTIFMFFRFVMPFVLFAVALLYINVVLEPHWSGYLRLSAALGAALLGYYLPDVYVTNRIVKRKEAIMVGFPDALDLLLICVESGMSAEMAFNKVSQEIGRTSPILAEEFAITTAELSYLPDRKQAFDNLALRCISESVQAVATALSQSEKYGTPLGAALRTCARENRETRMALAEKKAAALPAKLTVPMIVFFLPCLFVVIMGPAIMKVAHIM